MRLPYGNIDPTLKRVFDIIEDQLTDLSPYASSTYVDVTFATANVDTDITHPLRPADPESIDYQVVRASGPGVVYQDQSGTRKVWGRGVVVLRCSQPVTVTLLLTIRRA